MRRWKQRSVERMRLRPVAARPRVARPPADPSRFPSHFRPRRRRLAAGGRGSGGRLDASERFGAELQAVTALGGKPVNAETVRASFPEIEVDRWRPVDALVARSTRADLVGVGSRGVHGLRARQRRRACRPPSVLFGTRRARRPRLERCLLTSHRKLRPGSRRRRIGSGSQLSLLAPPAGFGCEVGDTALDRVSAVPGGLGEAPRAASPRPRSGRGESGKWAMQFTPPAGGTHVETPTGCRRGCARRTRAFASTEPAVSTLFATTEDTAAPLVSSASAQRGVMCLPHSGKTRSTSARSYRRRRPVPPAILPAWL